MTDFIITAAVVRLLIDLATVAVVAVVGLDKLMERVGL